MNLDNYPYAGISIFEGTAPQEDFRRLDGMLEDGDLTQGRFRQTPNGRYTYIIDEGSAASSSAGAMEKAPRKGPGHALMMPVDL